MITLRQVLPVSLDNRPYYRDQYGGGGYGGGGGGFRGGFAGALPRWTPAVKALIVANVVVFALQLITKDRLSDYLAATGDSWQSAIQVWRVLTFQFLHSTRDPFHLLFNMIGLFFLGPLLERSWGSRRFVVFYLTCGGVGGALYVLASLAGIMSPGYLVGASGGVLGILAACAVLFPQVTLILLFFPMPIRTAAILLTVVFFLFVVTGGHNAGGHLCHLGGMATGFLWVVGKPWLAARINRAKPSGRGRWEKKQQDERALQFEVDRILAKVRDHGLNSLTRKEKATLQRATEQQRSHDSHPDYSRPGP